MADTPVAADIHQTFDIELYDRTAFALDLDTHIRDLRTNCADLFIRPILNLEVVADTGLAENFAGGRATDAVDIRQADLAAFVFWLIYTYYTCHKISLSLINRLNITLGAF